MLVYIVFSIIIGVSPFPARKSISHRAMNYRVGGGWGGGGGRVQRKGSISLNMYKKGRMGRGPGFMDTPCLIL
jgi:hypothetical protein